MNLTPRPRARAAVALVASAVLLPTTGLLCAPQAQASSGPELAVNGSFELGTDGWRTNTADTSLSTASGGPDGARHAVLGSTTTTTVVLNDRVNTVTGAEQGSTYHVSAWVRSDVPKASGQLRVREVGGGSDQVHSTGFYLATTDWVQVELDVDVVGDGSDLDLNVLAWDNAPERHLGVDGVSVTRTDVGTGGETDPGTGGDTGVETGGETGGDTGVETGGEEPVVVDPRPVDDAVAGRLLNGCDYSRRGIPSCGAYFGGVTGGNLDPTAFEAEMGHTLGVRRTYFQANGIDSAVATARRDLANGRMPWISFKAPHSWAAMADGAGDAWVREIATKLDALDGPVWVAVHHEPENDTAPIEQWTRMQEHIGPILRSHADNVGFSVIVMGYHQLYGAPEMRFDAMWPDTKVDIAGFDVYNFQGMPQGSGIRTDPVNLKQRYFLPLQQWSQRTGIPWGLAETGYTDYTAEQKPRWIRRSFKQLKSAGGVAYSYFNSALNSKANWTLSSASKQLDYGIALKRSVRLPRLGSSS